MQGDFANFVDSLYGTTTTKLETTDILPPSALESKKGTVNWALWALLLSIGILLLFVFIRLFQKDSKHEMPFEGFEDPVKPHGSNVYRGHGSNSGSNASNHGSNLRNPVLQQMQPLYEASPSLPVEPEPEPEPETFPIHGEIPVSDDSEDEHNDSKLSGDGSDIQDYLRRREAVTKSLEKPN